MNRLWLLLILLLFGLWAFLVVYGVVELRATEAEGSGFTRGLNKLKTFFSWEALALGTAFVVWIIQSKSRATGASKWLGRAPLIASGGFFLLVIGAYVVAIINTRFLG